MSSEQLIFSTHAHLICPYFWHLLIVFSPDGRKIFPYHWLYYSVLLCEPWPSVALLILAPSAALLILCDSRYPAPITLSYIHEAVSNRNSVSSNRTFSVYNYIFTYRLIKDKFSHLNANDSLLISSANGTRVCLVLSLREGAPFLLSVYFLTAHMTFPPILVQPRSFKFKLFNCGQKTDVE